MEDVSPEAVAILSSNPDGRRDQIGRLLEAGVDIAVLLAAAAVLECRSNISQ